MVYLPVVMRDSSGGEPDREPSEPDDIVPSLGSLFAEGPDVRALFVTEEGGRLLGVVTRKTLVREVVAAGLDPRAVALREIAEPPYHTLDAGLGLDEAFRFLEEQDLERVPVVEQGGRLVGVLSRAVVRRRLAEDETPED